MPKYTTDDSTRYPATSSIFSRSTPVYTTPSLSSTIKQSAYSASIDSSLDRSTSIKFFGSSPADTSTRHPATSSIFNRSTPVYTSLYRSTAKKSDGSSTAENSAFYGSGFVQVKGSSVATSRAGYWTEKKPKQQSLAENNPGFWADYVKREQNIRNKWERDYGHMFPRNRPDLPPSGKELNSECRHYELHDRITTGNAQGCLYDYSATGKDHVAPYSTNFGHHTAQFHRFAEQPTSANDFYLQVRSSARTTTVPRTEPPICLAKPGSAASGPDKWDGIHFAPDARVDLDKIPPEHAASSRDDLLRQLYEAALSRVCPKCSKSVGCTCVSRRPENIAEDPRTAPTQELPSWPTQVWCGPSYARSRLSEPGDLLRLRYSLSRDNDKKTPMNRMFGEMTANNYYGATPHAGEDNNICPGCRIAREAEPCLLSS